MDVESLKKHIARVVKTHREQLNLSQTALGQLVGLSETTISRIERAEYLPSLEKAYSLAKALNTHPMVLLQGDSLTSFLKALPREAQIEIQSALSDLISRKKPR